VEASERNVLFNVTLTPATSSTVTVLSPNSEPAAGAQIGLAIPGAGLQLIPGGFSDRSKPGSLLKANGQGQFQLPSDPGMTRVIAATPDGYADVEAADLASQPTIQLQPWGRLEGTCLTNGQPAVNLPLHFQFGANDSQTIDCDLTAFQIKSDKEGRFAFPQVPPGNHELVFGTSGTNDAGYWTTAPVGQLPILSGQTTTVTIRTGQPVNANR
jgi:hypothetical protein